MSNSNYFATPVLILLSFFVFQACAESSEDNANYEQTTEQTRELAPLPDGSVTEQVQFLVDLDRYEEALEILRNEDQDDDEIQVITRDTHLHYGNWLMYHAETIQMNERMPMALAHFRRVLELDPQNSQARANIQQIEDIYQSMGREIPQGVAS